MSCATSRAVQNTSRSRSFGVAAVVGRRAVEADVVELDLADIEDVELLDHDPSNSKRDPGR